MSNTKYPFTEGEHYFTIEDNIIVESVWDDQSEEMFSQSKLYFRTIWEAWYFYRFTRTDEVLHNVVMLLGELKVEDDESNEKITNFLEGYSYFNTMPKLKLL